MEVKGVADIIIRPRQFIVMSSLSKTLPRDISQNRGPGTFDMDDRTALIPAKEFDPCKKRKIAAVWIAIVVFGALMSQAPSPWIR
ncbi:uncharacterized protein N7500_006596 [Penicillium coprophilum]|uniref:uncharacterized protein n=1 Tax=Penicillium coprophilum TaxID=36646 RepID=UPI00239BCF99|nr:uncharacterized protein N7500_006596 [Penicillium coprophilum]KAJ5164766.1 hypothetical protein N7500_006596 [Penicillium coprophilum]